MSFRCGSNGLVRVNYAQTVHFYNSSISRYDLTEGADVKWTKADIGVNWDTGVVYGKIGGAKFETSFYSDSGIDGVNGIMIYNLRASTTSYFANITVSNDLPTEGTLSSSLILCISSILYILYI